MTEASLEHMGCDYGASRMGIISLPYSDATFKLRIYAAWQG